MIQDIEAEKVTELLQTYFPNDTQEVLKRRFRVLSDLVNFAQRIGFCQKNDLKETLLDRNRNDRLFGQVRRALAKRHLTKDEQKCFYDAAYKAYFDGKMEYLGVLLRLLTGQADNVVCALKWKDLIYVDSLKLYYFIETRQITNDGKTIKALEDQKDYICFPCSDLMEQLLLRQRNEIQNVVGIETDIRELPVVISKECLENYQKQICFYPPTKLAKLEKDLLQEIGIKENVITVPTNDDRGTKDTDLNRYMGDFFRENFRYWSSNLARMSADEVAYALGSTQPSTVGHYYIDFRNEFSILGMKTKLDRWHSAIVADEEKSGRKIILKEGENHLVFNDGYPVELISDEYLSKGTEITFESDSDYTMRITRIEDAKDEQ